MLDLANKGDLSRSGGGQPPEFGEKPIIGGLDSDLTKGLGDMVALGLFDVETDLLDPLRHVEIEHLLGCRHAGRRQHRDHVKRELVPAQQPDAGDCPVEGTPARAGAPVAVMKMLGAIDADPDTDPLVREKPTPCIVDQGSVRLKRMGHRQLRGLQSIDCAECVAIELDRENHRLAGVPDDGQAIADPTRRKDLGKEIEQGFRRDDRLRAAMRKITITAIDIAERCRLDDQQLYSGHYAARGAITNYATSCAKGANCANCSNWAIPSRADALPSCA